MNEKKPWLFLKRVSAWSPLGDARSMMAPAAASPGPVAPKERKAWKLHARWSLEA